MEQIIDIGINLMHRSFSVDRETVIQQAEKVGVFPLIMTGTSLPASRNVASYAEKFPGKLYSTAGIHPHDAKSCVETTMGELRKLASKKQVVAIGECGLDYNRDFSPRNVQRKVFKDQIELAVSLKMPLFLHERDAFDDFYSMLKVRRSEITNLVVHCFTGNLKELEAYINLDCYIGITGWICDERRGNHLRELVKLIPLNRLMVETDAPFLTPRNLPQRPVDGRNEPKYLPHIVKNIADSIGIEYFELAEITTENALEFFGI